MKWTPLVLLVAACALVAEEVPAPPKPGLYAIFSTDFGDIRARLFEKETPRSVAMFVRLALGTQPWLDASGKAVKKPMFENLTFFRIIPEMIQSGSPTGKNTYNCGFTIQDEILPGIRFQQGSLALANAGPDTSSCQFFITTGPMHTWDGKYNIFGVVVDGLDKVVKMSRVPVHEEKPVNPPKLLSVSIERIGAAPGKKPSK